MRASVVAGGSVVGCDNIPVAEGAVAIEKDVAFSFVDATNAVSAVGLLSIILETCRTSQRSRRTPALSLNCRLTKQFHQPELN